MLSRFESVNAILISDFRTRKQKCHDTPERTLSLAPERRHILQIDSTSNLTIKIIPNILSFISTNSWELKLAYRLLSLQLLLLAF